MKPTIILLLTLLGLTLQAAHVRDDLGLLGNRAPELEQKLADSKVYVEFLRTADPTIRDYANAEIQKTAGTNGGFLIVVTTEPKAWRISEWPLGVVASSVIEHAGDAMVLQFHQHDFYQAVLDARAVLEPKAKADMLLTWWLGVGGLGLMGMVTVFYLIYRLSRVKPAARSKPAAKDESPAENLTNAQKHKADRIFNRYTTAEREEIAQRYYGTPQFCSGCHNDSFLFYWLLFNNGGLNQGGTTIINNINEPAPAYETVRETYTPSYTPERSRRSESSGYSSSPSWSSSSDSNPSSSYSSDSSGGGSSFSSDSSSSSSSSDSSGGGGSW